jgi:RNA polymerase sigma factor (sigma-70 family)
MTPEKIWTGCVKREEPAWEEFVSSYGRFIRKAVHYKINRMNSKSLVSEADDIIQEVFLMLWEDNKLESVKNISKLDSWLVAVSINKTIDYAQKRWKVDKRTDHLDQRVSEDGTTFKDLIPSMNIDQERELEYQEMSDLANEAISNLPERERRSLEKSMEGERQRCIASDMDIPHKTASSAIRRARVKVRKMMREYSLA